ncbi:DMT family transporter [Gilliamella sp. wkB112]|uniref:DMT family transporter n=1 Tax=Gilliamella sp. wkB112 TaxID=3120257 RepID=UPI00080E11B6|nr:DMT family transporter [Gilliamella apicola]OCG00395.1 hypothetical protein A9G12_04720 [Gilliamella apicola]
MIDLKRNGEWFLVAATILAALGWVCSKEAILGIPPLGFMAIRFLSASIILFPVCVAAKQSINCTNLCTAIFSGCLQAINITFWILAISLGGELGEGSFIMSLSVLMVPLIGWLFFKEKPLLVFWGSLPIAVIGLAFLTLSNGWQANINQIWFFIAALVQAVFFIFNSKFVQRMPILTLVAIQLFCTGFFCFFLSIIFETWPIVVSWIILGWVVISVLIATVLRFALQLIGQKYVPVGNAAIIMILEPIFTTIAGVLIYSEPMPWTKWTGCLLILISLLTYRGYVFIRSRRTIPSKVNQINEH